MVRQRPLLPGPGAAEQMEERDDIVCARQDHGKRVLKEATEVRVVFWREEGRELLSTTLSTNGPWQLTGHIFISWRGPLGAVVGGILQHVEDGAVLPAVGALCLLAVPSDCVQLSERFSCRVWTHDSVNVPKCACVGRSSNVLICIVASHHLCHVSACFCLSTDHTHKLMSFAGNLSLFAPHQELL